MQVYFETGEVLHIHDTPLASGGEGEIYVVDSSQAGVSKRFQHCVVKIFYPERCTEERHQKIQYLIKHPAVSLSSRAQHQAVVWPLKVVYDLNKDFLGFLMYQAKGEKLDILCSMRLPKGLSDDWKRFARSHVDSIGLRTKVCFNIAAALYQIHSSGRFVLVDMKPENILIQPNGLISFIDIDSIEVVDDTKTLFAASVVTPEFAPPEYHRGVRPTVDRISETWDCFSMGVIFYKLLCGIHPYAASCFPPHDRWVSLDQKIEQGLFVHDASKKDWFKVIPPPHKLFSTLSSDIQKLFIRNFVDGHESAYKRVSANEWCSAISGHSMGIEKRELPSVQLTSLSFSSVASVDFVQLTPWDYPTVDSEKYDVGGEMFEGNHIAMRAMLFLGGPLAFMHIVVSIAKLHPSQGQTLEGLLTLLALGVLVLGAGLFTRYSFLRTPEMKRKADLEGELPALIEAKESEEKYFEEYLQQWDELMKSVEGLNSDLEEKLLSVQEEEKERLQGLEDTYKETLESLDKEAQVLLVEEVEKRESFIRRIYILQKLIELEKHKKQGGANLRQSIVEQLSFWVERYQKHVPNGFAYKDEVELVGVLKQLTLEDEAIGAYFQEKHKLLLEKADVLRTKTQEELRVLQEEIQQKVDVLLASYESEIDEPVIDLLAEKIEIEQGHLQEKTYAYKLALAQIKKIEHASIWKYLEAVFRI